MKGSGECHQLSRSEDKSSEIVSLFSWKVFLKGRFFFCLLFFAISAFFAGLPHAFAAERDDTPTSQLQLIPLKRTYERGKPIPLLIQIHVTKGSKTYWKNPGESGISPSFRWYLPSGFSVKNIRWPTPQLFEKEGLHFFGYEDTVSFLADLDAGESAQGSYVIELQASWLECNALCVPRSAASRATVLLNSLAVSDESLDTLAKEAESLMPLPQKATFVLGDNLLMIMMPHEGNGIQSLRLFPEEEEWTTAALQATFMQKGREMEIRLPLPRGFSRREFEVDPFHAVVTLQTGTSMKSFSLSKEPSSLLSEQTISVVPEKGIMEELGEQTIWNFLLIGFLGGLILNVMPCVLPVIGLKLMYHIASPRRSYLSSLFSAFLYTLGILLSFWAMAFLLVFLQRAGMSYGWGFQLQNPYFVAFLFLLFVGISANLFGLFEWGLHIAAWAQESEEEIKKRETSHIYFVAFASGILTTLVATPCTGPLLGALIGISLSLSYVKIFLLFSALALGLASPFLLAALLPVSFTSHLLPKPGNWMNTLKQFLGFLLLLTSLWLLWILSFLVQGLVYELALLGAFGFFFGAWLYGKSQALPNALSGKCIFLMALVVSLLALSCTIASFEPSWRRGFSSFFFGKELEWHTFSFERLQKEIEAGKIVMVDGNARWCLTCQANDLVLAQEGVKKYLLEKEVVLLKADWTRNDSEVTEWLHSVKRNGVPTIALYKQGKEVVLLPELITPDIVQESISSLLKEEQDAR